MKKKELILSLSKKKGDFVVETFSGSGAGGQNRNRKQKCVRIKHPASGAVATGTEERSLEKNTRKAFRRLIETPKFKSWLRIKTAQTYDKLATLPPVDERIEEMMKPENLKIEVKKNGKWVVI